MKIIFIQTGGTIDKDYPKTKKGWAFEIGEPAVNRLLPLLNPSFDYEIIPFLQKDSLEITQNDRALLLSTCRKIQENKIIITHGTDSMIETAAVLNTIQNKTIILTGAFRPERFSNSDAALNLGIAIGAIQALSQGVYLTMNGIVYPWNKIKRDPQTGKFIALDNSKIYSKR